MLADKHEGRIVMERAWREMRDNPTNEDIKKALKVSEKAFKKVRRVAFRALSRTSSARMKKLQFKRV